MNELLACLAKVPLVYLTTTFDYFSKLRIPPAFNNDGQQVSMLPSAVQARNETALTFSLGARFSVTIQNIQGGQPPVRSKSKSQHTPCPFLKCTSERSVNLTQRGQMSSSQLRWLKTQKQRSKPRRGQPQTTVTA